MLCRGFLAIIKALEGAYMHAAVCIVLAGLMDLIDGRLARALGSSSHLGMELDSLCDAISFCFAPTIVLYSWKFHAMGFLGLGALVIYLFAGLFRLAKFNVTEASDYQFFIGLPTPLAALSTVCLIINEQALFGSAEYSIHLYGLIAVVMMLALLMIAPLKFPSGKKSRIPMAHACGIGIAYVGRYALEFGA